MAAKAGTSYRLNGNYYVYREYNTKAGRKGAWYQYKNYNLDVYKKKNKAANKLPAKESLITKTGKIKKTKLEQLFKTYQDKIKTPVDKLRVEELIKARVSKQIDKGNAAALTFEQAYAMYTDNKLITMLTNSGFTLDQLATKAETTVKNLLNEANWNDTWDLFTNEKGHTYKFSFTYDGDTTFERIDLVEVSY